MSDSWNPTIKTPNGDVIEPDRREGYIQPYRKESVLRQHVEDGLCTREIAEEYGVSITTIQENFRKHGLEFPERGIDPRDRFEHTRELHDEYGVPWGLNQYCNDGEGRVERMADGGHELANAIEWVFTMYECPDCGAVYLTEAGQHDCMRGHAKTAANELAQGGQD